MSKQGILVIISGPSGSGKGTIVSDLVKKDNYCLSISVTTRAPRAYEKEGVHYFFRSRDDFEQMKENDQLLEWACFCGNFYGTPKSYVEEKLAEGKNVILEIEVQGALQVKKLYPKCVLVFTMPPSLEELKKRLTGRGTEDEKTIEKRIHRALEEIDLVSHYDYIVINDTIEQAIQDIDTIVRAEKMRSSRNGNVTKLFRGEIEPC